MSTYDGDVVSWRLMLPYAFISNGGSSIAGGDSWYVYQTMPHLPTQWNMTYDSSSGQIEVFVYGPAGMCGKSFDDAKAEQEVRGSTQERPIGRRADPPEAAVIAHRDSPRLGSRLTGGSLPPGDAPRSERRS